MIRWWLPVLVWSQACVVSPPQWRNARDRAVCDVLVTCFDVHPSLSACRDALEGDEPPCPSLRLGATWQCLRQLRRQSRECPTSLEEWQVPASCALVCREGRGTADEEEGEDTDETDG